MNLLRRALKHLLSAREENASDVINDLLARDGKYTIHGLGRNVVTKILAVHDPRKWAVLNGPVEHVLGEFGYAPLRGSPGEKYIAFIRLMNEFKKETGLSDAYALDTFFFRQSKRMKSA